MRVNSGESIATNESREGNDQVRQFITRLAVKYRSCITDHIVRPAQQGKFVSFPEEFDARLQQALCAKGINKLYSHQFEAWNLIHGGKHTVIVTPTASGKSLCYNLPVLNAVMKNNVKALYLFPTKALSQDQVAEIVELNRAAELGVRAYTFDGDTPGDARRAVRTRGDIVVSNPDMLHQAILPHHTKWAQFFENLRYVVIDEMHTYRGVFGSHMANVIRRLRRVCKFYGTTPTFVFTSATIANPSELAEQLLGEKVTAITQSGAPSGEKHLLLWNPPVINPDLGIRASNRSQVTKISRAAIKAKLKTIIFANTRIMVEVITKYLKDVFDNDPRRPARVFAYRGGYLPTERRATETKMRSGEIDCVISTSALELGVDIGSLDICLLNGYPGTIAATWQRLGRAGRRNRAALGVLVASSEPLDQYIVRNPVFFKEASPEHARIDPDQLLILMDHVRCAAFELPFRKGETFGKENLEELLAYLEQQGVVHREAEQWHWMADSYPADSVSLRSVADGNFVVIDIDQGKQNIIAEVDFASAPMTIYPGAIYMVQARPWQVEQLDWQGRKAFVKPTRADYYTDAIDYTKLKILDEFEQQRNRFTACMRGEVHLVRHISGYKKIRFYTHENIGYGKVNLPDHELHTSAVWWQVDSQVLLQVFQNRWQALDGFLGAAYAMHYVAALLTMSEKHDLGRSVGDSNGKWFATVGVNGRGSVNGAFGEAMDIEQATMDFTPTLFLYDNYPGGIGLSPTLFDLRDEVINMSQTLIRKCSCGFGCPACVGPILGSDERQSLSPKAAALRLLDALTSEDIDAFISQCMRVATV